MSLRPYQQDAVDAAIKSMKASVMPGLLELATGSGKSHIVAAIAHWVHSTSGKRVLCLQPSKELTEQNFEKYTATGNKASIFSASAGSKCMRHPVVYATPGTVKNSLSRFGDQFAAVILDEAHGLTPTIKMIIGAMRERNPLLRVLGMTATPYRLREGYIYNYDIDGDFMPESIADEPYFNRLLYRITTQELIDMGFLTPAHSDPDLAQGYEGSSLELNARGQYDAFEVERVFEGRGRLTADIVADIVHHAAGRRGVMIFAATVQHAIEIMESLPPGNSMMLGGSINMDKSSREKLIKDFKAQRYKYLVSVATLTTGFDAPHVDLIAVMRATESAGLLQQIMGRGLRLYDGKEDCVILDYAENIERFDLITRGLFSPDIRAYKKAAEGEGAPVICPDCDYENKFTLNKDYLDSNRDKYGYILDLACNRVESEYGPIPAHHGRRCTGQIKDPAQIGAFVRCCYRWTSKPCPECEAPNDLAARYCSACKAELVDPNEKLRRDFIRVKKDPYAVKTERVLKWSAMAHTSQAGDDIIRCDYQTDYRTFSVYFTPGSKHPKAIRAWESLNRSVYNGHIAPDAPTFLRYMDRGRPPETVTYKKQKTNDFFEVIAHNHPEDTAPQ